MKKRTSLSKYQFNLNIVIAVFYILISFYTQSTLLSYGYIFVLIYFFKKDFLLGIMAWSIIAPIVGGLNLEYLFLFYTPIPIFAYFIELMRGKQNIAKNNFGYFLFFLSLFPFLGVVFTGYHEFLHVLGILVMVSIMAFIFSQLIIKENKNIFLIGNALIISALIATISSLFFGSGEIRRLALGESIRQLANAIGIGIVMLVNLYLFTKKDTGEKLDYPIFKFFNSLKYFFLFLLLTGLVFTMSRGVIFSLFVSFSIFFILNFIKNIYNYEVKLLFRSILVVGLAFILIIKFGKTIVNKFSFDYELLVERFSGESVEGGTDSRSNIWAAGISGLEGSQIIHGHGLSSFRMLANKNGYNYYSHSVFVDTLVSAGILGAITLLLLLATILRSIILKRDIRTFSIFIFTIMAYSTHGTMSSIGFWILIGICFGLAKSQEKIII